MRRSREEETDLTDLIVSMQQKCETPLVSPASVQAPFVLAFFSVFSFQFSDLWARVELKLVQFSDQS